MISIFANEAFLVLLAVNLLLAWGLYPMVVTGQLSLGQAGFMAVGAYASAWANVKLGWPIALSIPFGILCAAGVALPVAIGANRVRGIYLALGTLAVGQVLVTAISGLDALGGVEGYSGMDPVSLDQVLFVAVVVFVILWATMRARIGIAMRSIREDEDAARAIGVQVRRIKIGAVVLGASITGLAGALDAHYLSFIRPDAFGVELSFLIALSVLVGGTDTLAGPAAGAFVLTYFPQAVGFLQRYEGVAYGLLLIAVMIVTPRGLVTRGRVIGIGAWTRARLRLTRSVPASAAAEPGRRTAGPSRARGDGLWPSSSTVLELRGIHKRFAGLVALDGVDLAVGPGEIVGLIGPNGAGKTTLVDIATGLLRATEGTVEFLGTDISSLPPDRRAERGVARTFQSVRLFPHLTVEENLAVAAPRHRVAASTAVLERLRLEAYAGRLPGELPYGLQRMLQIGVALTTDPIVMFLDEPSIGVSPAETMELVELVRSIRGEGRAIIIIDHNLDLVTTVADRLVVLDFGRKIADGPIERVLSDPVVQTAYLGMATSGPEP